MIPYELLADLAVLVHTLFVLFVIGGGVLVIRWPKLAWLHLPAACWGVAIELGGSFEERPGNLSLGGVYFTEGHPPIGNRIEVRFLIDANGILSVTARDTRTCKEQSIEVKPSYGLTDEQVEAMIQESMQMAEADFHERQVRDARVEADRILSAVEKAKLSPAYLDLTEDEKRQIEDALRQLQTVYHSDDHLSIRAQMEALDKATLGLAEKMMDQAVSTALKGTKI